MRKKSTTRVIGMIDRSGSTTSLLNMTGNTSQSGMSSRKVSAVDWDVLIRESDELTEEKEKIINQILKVRLKEKDKSKEK